jgi:hypothetical protein
LDLNIAIAELFATSEKAYRAYPKEADSTGIEVAVRAAFKAGAKKQTP